MFTLYPSNKIYEWSAGYSIRSTDLSLNGRYVNFSMHNIKPSPILKFEKKDGFVSVDIPDNLLQHHGVLQVYVYDIECKYIEYKLEYFVYHKNKPDDYIYVEPQDKITWSELDRRITALESSGSTGSGGDESRVATSDETLSYLGIIK